MADHVGVCFWGRTATCIAGSQRGFLMSGGSPAGFLPHVGLSQRIHFIWWARRRLRRPSVCVCVFSSFAMIEKPSLRPFCPFFESSFEVWTQQLQVHVCKTAPNMRAWPRSSTRSRSVKLDGGLSEVIMSKVPFSQDEHSAAKWGTAILYLILITAPCFFNNP